MTLCGAPARVYGDKTGGSSFVFAEGAGEATALVTTLRDGNMGSRRQTPVWNMGAFSEARQQGI